MAACAVTANTSTLSSARLNTTQTDTNESSRATKVKSIHFQVTKCLSNAIKEQNDFQVYLVDDQHNYISSAETGICHLLSGLQKQFLYTRYGGS